MVGIGCLTVQIKLVSVSGLMRVKQQNGWGLYPVKSEGWGCLWLPGNLSWSRKPSKTSPSSIDVWTPVVVCRWQRRWSHLMEESWGCRYFKGDVLIAIRQITLIYKVTELPSVVSHLPQSTHQTSLCYSQLACLRIDRNACFTVCHAELDRVSCLCLSCHREQIFQA